METFFEIVSAVCNPIIRCSPLLILILIIVRLVDKHPNKTILALNIIRWLFVSFALFYLLELILSYDKAMEQEAFRLRVMGPYWWAYWTMIFFSSVFPLILLIKKLGRNLYLLLFISIMMNIGWLFETFVIVMSLHRDYI